VYLGKKISQRHLPFSDSHLSVVSLVAFVNLWYTVFTIESGSENKNKTNPQSLAVLLEAGADVMAVDEAGSTAMQLVRHTRNWAAIAVLDPYVFHATTK
jgi:hypothetical protein